MSTKFLAVREWRRLQHYQRRHPPWIKLHRELTFASYAFQQLPEAQQGQLMKIWLLASEYDNRIPYNAKFVADEIKASRPFKLEAFILDAPGFLEVVDSPADVPTPDEAPYTPERERIEAYLGADGPAVLHRFLESQRRWGRSAQVLLPAIASWLEGIGMPDKQPPKPQHMLVALNDIAHSGKEYSGLLFRTFARRAAEDEAHQGNGKARHGEVSGTAAEKLWVTIRSAQLHHCTTEDQIDRKIAELVEAGAVRAPDRFKSLLARLDLVLLRSARTDYFAITHIAERLRSQTREHQQSEAEGG